MKLSGESEKTRIKFVVLKKVHTPRPVSFRNLDNAISAISTSVP